MADNDEKEASSAAEPEKKKRPILLIVVVAVLVGGAAAAGIFLGPMLKGAPAAAEPIPSAELKAAEVDVVKQTVAMAPLVIDTKDAEGLTHHIKVAVSLELKDGTEVADFNLYAPRGREAAIAYLRSQSFETLTAAHQFESVRKELEARIIAAVGDKRASRVLITDFVAQ